METELDRFIQAIPDGRNDRCPCGCGVKMKKFMQEGYIKDFDEHVARFSKLTKEK